MTGTLAAPLARALYGKRASQAPSIMSNPDLLRILAALRSDPEVVGVLAEALVSVAASQYVETAHGTMWHDLNPGQRAAALLDALLGPKP